MHGFMNVTFKKSDLGTSLNMKAIFSIRDSG
jgi:hypothetical protein